MPVNYRCFWLFGHNLDTGKSGELAQNSFKSPLQPKSLLYVKNKKMNNSSSKLKREINPMPEYIEKALEDNGVRKDYLERPAYQRNDYLAWIERAKKNETKQKRLNQMLHELKVGGVYMKMKHSASTKK